jgi:tetratricopeptide (TPR) repeat protein
VDAGEEFEIAREKVDIIEPMQRKNDPGVVVPVTIYIEPKRNSTRTAVGTVDASTGGVPDAARELYEQAIESAKSGDRKKAIDELKQALAIYPNFMTALNELGVQYIALKQFKEAAEALRTAIKIAPEAFHPRLNYGIVLMNLKNYKDAASELQIAVQKDSSSATAHFYFGRALVSLGNYDAAEKALRQTISIGGDEATEAHRYLGAVYIEKHDGTRAADELDQYLKLAPKAKDADKIRAIIKDLRSQASTKP